ncbi:MAG: hypothetical protein JWO86_2798 [Myxococcaceae bacterium]|nr:hypothetical protein [Myxococcaceae bacterium]
MHGGIARHTTRLSGACFGRVGAIALGALCVLGAGACDKSNQDAADTGTSKENPAPTPIRTVSKPPFSKHVDPRPAGPTATIEGVGDVPAWGPDKTTKRCAASAESKTKIEGVRKGTDAALATSLAAGTADVAALAKDLGADVCIVTRRALANALHDAGALRYDAKKIDEANRYWRAALALRPSLVLARYDLARGLALAGKGDAAVVQMSELARAATESDANAAIALEKAKTEKDLESVREQPSFQAAVKASNAATLVGPRKDPETSTKAIALLPEEFRKLQDDIGATPNRAIITFKPAFTNFWTWHPDASTELLVATVVDDPAKIGQPKADITLDYGAIAVLRREPGGKVTLLTVRKTGDSQPTVAGGKNGSVIYSFEQMCGGLSGTLTWNGKSIDMAEKNCRDLP